MPVARKWPGYKDDWSLYFPIRNNNLFTLNTSSKEYRFLFGNFVKMVYILLQVFFLQKVELYQMNQT